MAMAAVGHACWDVVLHWMVVKDPDASVLHMHWLRMCFLAIMLQAVAIRTPTPRCGGWMWWLRFSIVGWVLPGAMYTSCVMLSGYRVAISFQPIIPLLVSLRTNNTGKQYGALTVSLLGTWVIWLYSPWQEHNVELWALWFSIICICVQVISQQEWFVMMNKVKSNRIKAIAHGASLAVVILFFSMIIWTPQHLNAAYMTRWDNWVWIMFAAALSTTCKFLGIAFFSNHFTCDGVAVFECLHPVATLMHDVVLKKDIIEYFDIVAILCFATGWILYPKRIYTSVIHS